MRLPVTLVALPEVGVSVGASNGRENEEGMLHRNPRLLRACLSLAPSVKAVPMCCAELRDCLPPAGLRKGRWRLGGRLSRCACVRCGTACRPSLGAMAPGRQTVPLCMRALRDGLPGHRKGRRRVVGGWNGWVGIGVTFRQSDCQGSDSESREKVIIKIETTRTERAACEMPGCQATSRAPRRS